MDKKKLALGAGIGLVAYYFFSGEASAFDGSVPFIVKDGVRYWAPHMKQRIFVALDKHTVKETGTERVVQFEFGGSMPGANGLGWVRKMQLAGYVCTSSSNLLDDQDPRPRMVAAILPGQERQLADALLSVGDLKVAVLPSGL